MTHDRLAYRLNVSHRPRILRDEFGVLRNLSDVAHGNHRRWRASDPCARRNSCYPYQNVRKIGCKPYLHLKAR